MPDLARAHFGAKPDLKEKFVLFCSDEGEATVSILLIRTYHCENGLCAFQRNEAEQPLLSRA